MVAARRKKPVAPAAGDAGAFAVVVETLRGDFRVFGEALTGLRGEVADLRGEVHAGFERVDRELTSVRADMSEVKHDLSEVKHELSEVKHDLSEVKHELGLVKSAVLEHGRELREIRDRKVDREEVEGIVQGVVSRVR
jgi:predicted  nucleic acid-binding Zn-ribbon protein